MIAVLILSSLLLQAADAMRLMQDRRFAEADIAFEKALAADPDNDALRIQYATCLFAEERNDDARRQFEIERRRLGDRSGLSYFLGQLDLRASDYPSAIAKLQPLAADPAFPKAAYYLGLAYLADGKTAPALASLERAAKNNPRDPEVHYRLARVYSTTGHSAEADREYKLYRDARESQRLIEQQAPACMDALRSQPGPAARAICQKLTDPILLGRLYAQAGAFTDALEPLKAAAKLEPQSFEAWHYLGMSLFWLHRYQEALPALEKAAALNPQYFDTLNLLANTLHSLGNDAAALPILERAHNLNPSDARVNAALRELRLKH